MMNNILEEPEISINAGFNKYCKSGAGEENRTLVVGLGSRYSAIELHLQILPNYRIILVLCQTIIQFLC